jgi:hypothetical protein
MKDLPKGSMLAVLGLTIVISGLISILDCFTLMSTQNSARSGPGETTPANTNLLVTDNLEAAALRKHALVGDIDAARQLGFLYADGKDVPENRDEATRWLQFATDHGDICAHAGLIEFGLDVTESKQKAFSLFMQVAPTGDSFAQYRLGLCYLRGFGVANDNTQAMNWFQKAADQGCAQAQVGLAFMYYDGDGVPKDLSQAVNWCQKAAAQGNPRAQYMLGAFYEVGKGVPQDFAQAMNWYQKAADQGLAQAQWGLGGIYDRGEGVPKDIQQAKGWYQKAADQGNAEAQSALQRLKVSPSP